MAGRRGMRARKPDMEGHEPGFGAAADHREHEDQIARPRGKHGPRGAELAEGRGATGGDEQKRAEQTGEAHLGHAEIPLPRSRHLRAIGLDHHEEVRAERHAFPAEEEGQGAVGERDETHAEEEHVEHEARLPLHGSTVPRACVARAVERRRCGDQAGQGEEDRAQPVEAEGETSRGGPAAAATTAARVEVQRASGPVPRTREAAAPVA